MDMDDAVRLLDAYLDAEWALTVAAQSDPDDAVVSARRAELLALTRPAPGTLLGAVLFDRPPGTGVVLFPGQLDELRRRPLFAVVEHANPMWGALFAAYAGSQDRYVGRSYDYVYFVAPTGDGPRVVSEYVRDLHVPALAWTHLGGVVVERPGPVVAVRRLDRPDNARDLAHWEAS